MAACFQSIALQTIGTRSCGGSAGRCQLGSVHDIFPLLDRLSVSHTSCGTWERGRLRRRRDSSRADRFRFPHQHYPGAVQYRFLETSSKYRNLPSSPHPSSLPPIGHAADRRSSRDSAHNLASLASSSAHNAPAQEQKQSRAEQLGDQACRPADAAAGRTGQPAAPHETRLFNLEKFQLLNSEKFQLLSSEKFQLLNLGKFQLLNLERVQSPACRRHAIMGGAVFAAAVAAAGLLEPSVGRALAEEGGAVGVASTAAAASESATASSETAATATTTTTASWKRLFAEDFEFRVPPGFTDITDLTAPAPSENTVVGERLPTNPFLIRLQSEDRQEVLSVVQRMASSLKLTFFEVKDITQLGSPEEAAQLFIPPGAKLLNTSVLKREETRVPRLCKDPSTCAITNTRTYYRFDFFAKGKVVAMSAAANAGQIYVFGGTSSVARWKETGGRMRQVAETFLLNP